MLVLEFGSAVDTEESEEVRRERAEQAMTNLSTGNYSDVAQRIIQAEEGFSCAICFAPFVSED